MTWKKSPSLDWKLCPLNKHAALIILVLHELIKILWSSQNDQCNMKMCTFLIVILCLFIFIKHGYCSLALWRINAALSKIVAVYIKQETR